MAAMQADVLEESVPTSPPEKNPTMAVGDGPLLTEGTRWEQRVLRRLPVKEAWLCCT